MNGTNAIILFCLLYPSIGQDIFFPKPKPEDSCVTSSGARGWCTDIRKCPSARRSITRGDHPALCRFDGRITIVCCPIPKGLAARSLVAAPRSTSVAGCGVRFPKLRTSTRSRFTIDRFPVMFSVGGLPSPKHSWPWMVLLVRKRGQKNDYFCGGAIINENYVITAAHCALSLEPFSVRIGEHNYNHNHNYNRRDLGTEDIKVDDVIFHPQYKEEIAYHDIVLLKLAKKITFKDEAKPICLPWGKLANEDLINKPVTLTGWGRLGFTALSSSILQEVNVTVFHPSKCSQTYSTLPKYSAIFPEGMTPTNMVCAGTIEGGKDACDGDSGGPLMHYERDSGKYTLVAIISKGFGCGKKDFPGLNSPIRNLETLQWIKTVAFAE